MPYMARQYAQINGVLQEDVMSNAYLILLQNRENKLAVKRLVEADSHWNTL